MLHVRHALMNKSVPSSAKQQCEITTFYRFDEKNLEHTSRTRSSKSLILCFHMITIRARQAKMHLAYFVQCDQHGIIAKHLT